MYTKSEYMIFPKSVYIFPFSDETAFADGRKKGARKAKREKRQWQTTGGREGSQESSTLCELN